MAFAAKMALIGVIGFAVVVALLLLAGWLSESGVPWGYRLGILVGFLASVVVAIVLNVAGTAGQ